MGLIAMDSGGGGDFELTPAGNFIARCYAVVDLGMQTRTWQGVENQKRIVRLSWELPSELMEDGRPFSISQNYTLSLHENAALRRDLQSWRGRDFTEEELGGFDLFTVLGVPALINVIHKPSQDGSKTYANIGSISPLMKGMDCPAAVNEVLKFSLDEYDDITFNKLPEWLQKKINIKGVQTPGAVHDDGQYDDRNPPPEFDDQSIPF